MQKQPPTKDTRTQAQKDADYAEQQRIIRGRGTSKLLPLHLVGMTQGRWDRMSDVRRAELRDNSALHPELIGLEGKVVTVTPDRGEGRLSAFRVGKSTGWQPVHLAVSKGGSGSSDIIGADEKFNTLRVVR